MTFDTPVQFPEGRDFLVSDVVVRRESQPDGLWRIDICQTLYGYQVKLARRDSFLDPPIAGEITLTAWMGYEVVYCMGRQKLTLLLLPNLIAKVLERFDESAGADEVRKVFPVQTRKPMHNDPDCWRALCELVGVPSAREIDLACSGEVEFRSILDEPAPSGGGA